MSHDIGKDASTRQLTVQWLNPGINSSLFYVGVWARTDRMILIATAFNSGSKVAA